MSSGNPYDSHCGKGLAEVGGYNSPAGSQADQARQRREADARRREEESQRQYQEQLRRSEAAGRQRREQAARQAEANRQTHSRRAESQRNVKKERAPAKQRARAKNQYSVGTGFGTLAFFPAALWAFEHIGPDTHKAIPFVVGAVAAVIVGKFYKVIITLAIVAFAIFVWKTAQM